MTNASFPCAAGELHAGYLGRSIGVAGTLLTGRLMQLELDLHESRPATVRVRLLHHNRSITVHDVAHDAIIVKRARA